MMWSGTFPWPATWRTIGRVGIGSAAAGRASPVSPTTITRPPIRVRKGLFMTSTSVPNAEVVVEPAHTDAHAPVLGRCRAHTRGLELKDLGGNVVSSHPGDVTQLLL